MTSACQCLHARGETEAEGEEDVPRRVVLERVAEADGDDPAG